jgi:hypothetical protein
VMNVNWELELGLGRGSVGRREGEGCRVCQRGGGGALRDRDWEEWDRLVRGYRRIRGSVTMRDLMGMVGGGGNQSRSLRIWLAHRQSQRSLVGVGVGVGDRRLNDMIMMVRAFLR